jgi:multidrug efflux pump subunit AcrA (membrane-fusion protein)
MTKKTMNKNYINLINKYSKKSFPTLTFSLTLFLAFICCICTVNLPAAGTPSIRGNKVQQGEFKKLLILTGSLKAQKAEEFIVPHTDSWEIQLKWMVDEGTTVKTGDPVARFDTTNLVTEIENLTSQLEVQEEQKKQKRSDYDFQEYELGVAVKQAEIEFQKKKLDASVPIELTTAQKYNQSQLEMKKSRHALEKAQREKKVKLAELDSEIKRMNIEMEETRTKLAKKQNTLKRLTLYAKSPGTVLYEEHQWQGRKIQVGDSVAATMKIASIPDPGSLQVEAWLSETEINHIKTGQIVDVNLDAYPGKDFAFTGSVSSIASNAERKTQWGDGHYFCVEINLDSRNTEIMKPGMSVKCTVHTIQHQNALLIPLNMLHFDGQSFWLKPKNNDPFPIEFLGINDFYAAVSPDHPKIKAGTTLEKPGPIEPSKKNTTEMINDLPQEKADENK